VDVTTQDAHPSMDDIKMFSKQTENVKDALKNILNEATAPLKSRVMKGDHVIVCAGAEKNLQGVVESVNVEYAMIKPLAQEWGIDTAIPIKHAHLKKYFKLGDHIKVTFGLT
jgi:transcription elongation factor